MSNKSLPIVAAALVLTSSLAAWAATVTDLNRNTANHRNWHNNVGGWY